MSVVRSRAVISSTPPSPCFHIDIIWLKENEEIPCDVLLLATPEPSGVCYIQTTNLDGESDLKLRQALPATAALSTDRIHRFRVRLFDSDTHMHTEGCMLAHSREATRT